MLKSQKQKSYSLFPELMSILPVSIVCFLHKVLRGFHEIFHPHCYEHKISQNFCCSNNFVTSHEFWLTFSKKGYLHRESVRNKWNEKNVRMHIIYGLGILYMKRFQNVRQVNKSGGEELWNPNRIKGIWRKVKPGGHNLTKKKERKLQNKQMKQI